MIHYIYNIPIYTHNYTFTVIHIATSDLPVCMYKCAYIYMLTKCTRVYIAGENHFELVQLYKESLN